MLVSCLGNHFLLKPPKSFRFKFIPHLEGSINYETTSYENKPSKSTLWTISPKNSTPKKTRKTPSRPVDSEDVLLAPQSSVGSEFPWRLRLSTNGKSTGQSHRIHGKKILLLSMGNPGWLIGILTHRIHVWNIYHYIPTFGWFSW